MISELTMRIYSDKVVFHNSGRITLMRPKHLYLLGLLMFAFGLSKLDAYAATIHAVASSEQSPQETTKCNQLAANPHDPNRITAGVLWRHLDAHSAIKACTEALEISPRSPRLQYQLGRAYLKQKNYKRALVSL